MSWCSSERDGDRGCHWLNGRPSGRRRRSLKGARTKHRLVRVDAGTDMADCTRLLPQACTAAGRSWVHAGEGCCRQRPVRGDAVLPHAKTAAGRRCSLLKCSYLRPPCWQCDTGATREAIIKTKARNQPAPPPPPAGRGGRHGQKLHSGIPPRQVDARSSVDACLSSQKVQGREANRCRHRLTEPTTKALCQPPPPRLLKPNSAPGMPVYLYACSTLIRVCFYATLAPLCACVSPPFQISPPPSWQEGCRLAPWLLASQCQGL